jgi:plasmid stability protein
MVPPDDIPRRPDQHSHAADGAARVTSLRLELPEAVMARLRSSAQRQGRSVSAETVALLQEGVVSAVNSDWARTPVKQARLVKSAGLHVELPEVVAAQLRELAHKAHRSLGVEAAHLLQGMLQTIDASRIE